MAELFSVSKAIMQLNNSSQPVELGVLQEVKFDISVDIPTLQGQNRYPILAVQGKGGITGSANAARFNPETMGVLLGATKTSGSVLLGNQVSSIPTTSSYTITVTNSATFNADGGVILVGSDELNNVPMTKVTGTPAAGQYAVSAGVYTFAAADKGKQVIIDYKYTSTGGSTLTLPNPVMGNSYPFSLTAETTLQGKTAIFEFPNVISGKFSLDMKIGEFTIPNFDMTMFADGAGNIGYIYTNY